MLMQLIRVKTFTTVLHTLELVDNNIFSSSRSAIGHPTQPLKVSLNTCFLIGGNSELFSLPLESLVSVEEPISVKNAHLFYASTSMGEHKLPQRI